MPAPANFQLETHSSHLVLMAANSAVGLVDRLQSLKAKVIAGGPLEPPVNPQYATHRLALVYKHPQDLVGWIDRAVAKLSAESAGRFQLKGSMFYAVQSEQPANNRIAFLFPGQGSQFPGMLDELCVCFPQCWSWFEELDRSVADLPVRPPSSLAFPPGGSLSDEQRANLVGLRGGAQLGVIANLALHELLLDVGVKPDMIVGHSNGEHAAMSAAGVTRADRPMLMKLCHDMLQIVLTNPRPARAEAVAAVSLADRETLDRVVARSDDLYLAMINCPSQSVIAGTRQAIDTASETLRASGALVVKLPFTRAYHTPLFKNLATRLGALYVDSIIGKARVPLYSCMTAEQFPEEKTRVREHAVGQLTRMIDFQSTVERLYADNARVFVEVGPGNALTGFVTDILRGHDHVALPVARAGQPPLAEFQRLLGRLFVAGVNLDFDSQTWQTLQRYERPAARLIDLDAALEGKTGATPDSVPSKPATAQVAASDQVPVADLSGHKTVQTAPAALPAHGQPRREIVRAHFALMNDFLAGQTRIFEQLTRLQTHRPVVTAAALVKGAAAGDRQTETRVRVNLESEPLLADHSLGPPVCARDERLRPLAVLPFTYSLEWVAAAALRLIGGDAVTGISDIRAFRWLALDRGELQILTHAEVDPQSPDVATIRLYEDTGAQPLLAFEARVTVAGHSAPADTVIEWSSAGRPTRWSADAFYRDYAFHGPAFRSLRGIELVDTDRIQATLEVPSCEAGNPDFHIDPALLDCAGQLVGLWLLEQGRENFGIFPFSLRQFLHHSRCPEPGAAMRATAQVLQFERGVTNARVQFFDANGRLVYTLDDFAQRYLDLPPCIARTLMGTRDQPRFVSESATGVQGVQRVIADLPHQFLDDSFGIWGRALAAQTLSLSELAHWYDDADQDVVWLLERIAAKEALREWVSRRHGFRLSSADVVIDSRRTAELAASCPEIDDSIIVYMERTQGRISASIPGPAHAGPEPVM